MRQVGTGCRSRKEVVDPILSAGLYVFSLGSCFKEKLNWAVTEVEACDKREPPSTSPHPSVPATCLLYSVKG